MDKNNRVPKFISFKPFRAAGFDYDLEEIIKQGRPRIRVKSVTCKGREVTKALCSDVLWKLGIDTKNHPWWITPKIKHRHEDSTREIFDYRYAGYERLDKEWIESGKASVEAHLASSKFSDIEDSITSYIVDVHEFDDVE